MFKASMTLVKKIAHFQPGTALAKKKFCARRGALPVSYKNLSEN
jgi:hypothetical protein